MIPLFAPKAGTYYFCWAIPRLVLVMAEVLRAGRAEVGSGGRSRRWWLLGGLVLSVALMLSAATQMLGDVAPHDVAFFTQAAGATCWGAVVLVIVLLCLLGVHRREAALGKL